MFLSVNLDIMNNKFKHIIILTLFCITTFAGQQKYCIYFTDKAGSTLNPDKYFENNSGKINDSSDYPVSEKYILEIVKLTGKISSTTRWLNAVIVEANKRELEAINNLSFVKNIEALNATVKLAKYKFKATLQKDAYNLMSGQVESMQGDQFSQKGIDGKDIRIAIFDAGFTGVDQSPIFEHLRENGQIVKTYDFVRKDENVYGYNQHGTMVLSCIAGIYNGEKLGMATGAEFLLARTESSMETLSEEEYWLQAVEWAYRNGAQIINSSLGYTYQRYFEKDMDGNTSFVAKAAAIAAKKGMLVVNAMGNDGENSWKYMCTPADVENVMAVGGIDPNTGIHIPFSSFGPTSDKRMKPNVSAYAHVVAGSNKKITEAYGTSFASPLVAGFAACVLQMHQDYNLDTLFNEIEKSGSLYPYFDYAHGYGIPQAGYFTENYIAHTTNISISEEGGEIKVIVNDNGGLMYYHIEKPGSVLEKYGVAEMAIEQAMTFSSEQLNGKTLRVHYKGTTLEKSF